MIHFEKEKRTCYIPDVSIFSDPEVSLKVVVAMDSFKGSLTSLEAGNAVKRGILRSHPDAEVTVIPLADGGEGTIDSIAPYIGGIAKTLTVTGPLGVKIKADYIFDPKTDTAYIEMAKAAGLTLILQEDRNPYLTTTFGVGELMKDAMENGAKKLVICIGGKTDESGFVIGVETPFSDRREIIGTVEAADKTLVTSGIYERRIEVDGKSYHHILDTATGWPVETDLDAVTLIADKGSSADIDALSTTCLIKGADEGMKLIENTDGVEAIFVLSDGNIRTTDGAGFEKE